MSKAVAVSVLARLAYKTVYFEARSGSPARDTPPSLLFLRHLCCSALHERVCVCGTAFDWPFPGPSVVVLRALLATVGRCRWSGGARGRAHD